MLPYFLMEFLANWGFFNSRHLSRVIHYQLSSFFLLGIMLVNSFLRSWDYPLFKLYILGIGLSLNWTYSKSSKLIFPKIIMDSMILWFLKWTYYFLKTEGQRTKTKEMECVHPKNGKAAVACWRHLMLLKQCPSALCNFIKKSVREGGALRRA